MNPIDYEGDPIMTYDRPACRCGHDVEAHVHYRYGSDCGVCGEAKCSQYRRADEPSLRTKVLAILGLTVAAWLVVGVALWLLLP